MHRVSPCGSPLSVSLSSIFVRLSMSSVVAKVNRKPKRWEWTKARLTAVHLLAEGQLSQEKIAAKCGVTTVTIRAWCQVDEFATKLRQAMQAFDMQAMSHGYARQSVRLTLLSNLIDRQKIIVEERAKAHGKLTGGSSGLVAHEVRSVGVGENATLEDFVSFDGSLNREMRATLAQIAEETGQVSSKVELSGPGGGPISITVTVLDDIVSLVEEAKRRLKEDAIDVEPIADL